MTIKFGTDGWRGVIAEDFTFENVRLCARGVAEYLIDNKLDHRGLIVGYDTRFLSEQFAMAVAEVAVGAGVRTYLCETAAPTPVISFNVLHADAGAGAIITASHNPSIWNGFKFKPEYAGSATPEIVLSLEDKINAVSSRGHVIESEPWSRALQSGSGKLIDPVSPYMEQIASLVDLDCIKDSGMKVAVDPMYGAGIGYIPALLANGKIDVCEIHGLRNPSFPGMVQPEPIAHNLSELSECVLSTGADVGLALDADADRFGLIDEKGNFINPLQVYGLLALYLLEIRNERGPLVKSLTATSMAFRLGEIFDVPVYETPVGFKYICPILIQQNALMGGEESGGFGFKGHIPERDGILSALFLLDLIVKTGKRPSELVEYLFSRVGEHYYRRDDVEFQPDQRSVLEASLNGTKIDSFCGTTVVTRDNIDGTRLVMEDGSWVVVRFSGTEPLLRIYCEASSPGIVDASIDEIRGLLGV